NMKLDPAGGLNMAGPEAKMPDPMEREAVSVIKPSATVLVIEDHADTAETVGEILKSEGYGVRVCETRDEALGALESYLYDFILMDLFMPGMTADAFVKHVKE